MPEVRTATKAQYSELRTLLQKSSARRSAGRFVVEGPVLVAELMKSPIEVVYLVGTEELLGVHAYSGVDLFDADPRRLAEALSTKSPQPIAAVARLPVAGTALPDGPVLALVDMGDPGNVGTMARTAEAGGCAAVALVGQCVDPWNPKVIRASAGASFRLALVALTCDELFESGRDVVATVVEAGTDYAQADLANAVICLGNEAHGLADDFVSRCTSSVTIPLAGPTESLNVAAAAAVVVFAALQQRRAVTIAQA